MIGEIYCFKRFFWSHEMSLGTILLVALILALLGVFPAWPHSVSWGYGPSGAVGTVLLVVLVLILLGRV
jgi:hypothetical protein